MKKTVSAFTLVIFSWCPKGGVGARRWAKFSKFLSRKSIHISVIATAYPYKDKVNWCQDVQNLPHLNTTFLPLRYPAFLLKKKRTFLVKLGTRLLKRTSHPVDASQKWAKGVVQEIIKSGEINQPIVLTVPPFSLLTVVPELSEKVPNCPLILDYRDPWQHSVSRSASGFIESEATALELSQEIWVTTQEHKRALVEIYSIPATKVFVVHNGFDLEDYRKAEVTQGEPGKAIYLGQMMEQRVYHLLDILSVLDCSGLTQLKQHFKITVYTDSTIPWHKFSKVQQNLLDKYVEFKAPVPAHEVPAILQQYRYGITIGVSGYDLTIPVKNFEYLALGKQILSFGPITSFHQNLKDSGHLVTTFNDESVLGLFAEMETQMANDFHAKTPKEYDIKNISELLQSRLNHWEEKGG